MLNLLKKIVSPRLYKIKDAIQSAGHIIQVFFSALIENLSENLKPWRPWFKRIANGISASSSFISTLQASFKITPVIVSAITVFTALPLFKMVFPTITVSQPVITLMLISIASIAAVRTYRDAIERDRLDKLIEENTRVISTLNEKVTSLEARLVPRPQSEPAPISPRVQSLTRELRPRQTRRAHEALNTSRKLHRHQQGI